MRFRRVGSAAVVATVALVITGCTVGGRGSAYVEEPPPSTVYVTSAPIVDYRSYPSAYYEGRTVYYVDNRWGYPNGDRWTYYRSEPPPLVRYRTHVDVAPPAPRGGAGGRYPAQPTPARPAAPPPQSAPPATRVR